MDGSFLISYKSPEEYNRTLNAARDKLCRAPATREHAYFQVTRHRAAGTMGLYYVAIFDENGLSAIDLYLTAKNFYIVGFRRPEMKWVVCAQQSVEEKALGTAEVGAVAAFGSSYPALGISAGNTDVILLSQCSSHVNALLAYYDARLVGDGVALEPNAKAALGYFAATIAEALRFHTVQRAVAGGRFNFATAIDLLQHWLGWSMRPDNQVPHDFAVVPIHENMKKEFANNIEDALPYFDTGDFILGLGDGTPDGVSKLGNFITLREEFALPAGDAIDEKKTVKKKMIDIYCRSRIDANVGARLMAKLRAHKGKNLKNGNAINGFFVDV